MDKPKKRPKAAATKPYPDFPLFCHATGQWAKKIRGKLHYFGADPTAALDKYLNQRDDLQAGRIPRVQGDGLTVRDLANRFLTSKGHLRATGELSVRTFIDYHQTCERLIASFGRSRLVTDLRSEDFERLRSSLAKTRGPVALGNEIQRVRSIFKYAFDEVLVEKPVRFGTTFKKPTRKTIRQARQAAGPRLLEAAECRKLLAAAPQPLKAMILLGLNCGFGQTDVATLPKSAIDLDKQWVDFPRPKTAVARRCPLWPETVKALSEAMVSRPTPKDLADENLVFVTKYGFRWVRIRKQKKDGTDAPHDAVGWEFAKVMKAAGVKRHGRFYLLRHTFRTVADGSKDQPAVDHIMGHIDDSMADRYRELIEEARLVAVTNLVHGWLWPPTRATSLKSKKV